MKALLFSLLLCAGLLAHSQNIVPNCGFESYTALPDNPGQWSVVNGWTNAGGSPVNSYFGDPDYFHNYGSGVVQMPNTALAVVHPHGGDAIMGFLGYHDPSAGSSDIREYLMVPLAQALSIDSTYEISFWITNGESGIGHYLQCDGIAACLSTSPLTQAGTSYIPRTPQLEVPGELFVVGWTRKTFQFTADSSYTHLTIGNFKSDANTSKSVALSGPLPFAGAYYFIDDVEIVPSIANSIAPAVETAFSLHPNPATDRVQLQLPESTSVKVQYRLSNLEGKVFHAGSTMHSIELDLRGLPAGVYVVELQGPQGSTLKKLVRW